MTPGAYPCYTNSLSFQLPCAIFALMDSSRSNDHGIGNVIIVEEAAGMSVDRMHVNSSRIPKGSSVITAMGLTIKEKLTADFLDIIMAELPVPEIPVCRHSRVKLSILPVIGGSVKIQIAPFLPNLNTGIPLHLTQPVDCSNLKDGVGKVLSQ